MCEPPSELEWREARQAHLEEELRLLHVTASRAQDRLYVSYVMPSPAPPPEPGAEEAADAETVVAAAAWNRFACLAPEPAPAANQTPPPLCSGVLAAAVRHLRREAPWALELVDVEPGLPGAEAFWYDCRERGLLPPAPCQQRQQRQQRQQQRPLLFTRPHAQAL